MDNYTIRAMRDDDISNLVRTFCFSWSTPEAISQKWNAYFAGQKEKKRAVYLIEVQKALVGYGSLLFHSENKRFLKEDIPEINDLWIDEAHRRCGFATNLIHFLEDAAYKRGYRKVGLGVGLYRDYGAAHRLYCRLGYSPDGEGITYKNCLVEPGKEYPVDDELILWMEKELK